MLSPRQIDLCRRTMSANAFFILALDAVENRKNLSVVRAADGEKKLFSHCRGDLGRVLKPFGEFTEGWLKRYGCSGIHPTVLADRIYQATTECTYFAPSISGIRLHGFDVYDIFPKRDEYVDNFFPNLWIEEQKIELFQKAGEVLMIHGNAKLAALIIDRAKRLLGVKVHWVELKKWNQSVGIIKDHPKYPLTIFSAGPASKYIGPRISGVTLDIGAAMGRWTFESTEIAKKEKNA